MREPEFSEVEETPEQRHLNNKIDLWHLGIDGKDMTLHEYLGWTLEEYAHWFKTGKTPLEEV